MAIRQMLAHPDLQDLRLWTLLTRDAHDLYRKAGFTEPKYPARCMERRSATSTGKAP